MSNSRGASPFFSEISDQPAVLSRLISHYASPAGRRQLKAVPAPEQIVLLGMGASYHVALIAAQHLEALGFEARALEAHEALHAEPAWLSRADLVIYISQSGASAEVEPLLERLGANTPLVALTNEPASPLARRARTVLPLLAGDEQTVATKTYLNSLAVLWLLGRQWRGQLDTVAFAALESVRARIAGLLAQGPALAERWIERLGHAHVFVYVGTGASAVTARQAAMMTMEWLKRPALNFSVGAFRHGPLEIAQPGLAAVVFGADGLAQASAQRLARQLEAYGAAVLIVEAAESVGPAVHAVPGGVDALLGQMLAIVPVQIFVEAMADQSGAVVGFKHIAKVTTTL
jgi:glucosamine--fructose-6-phosphate aminotransferase (isomerizing)